MTSQGTCPNCGRPGQADWQVCPHCGTPLQEGDAV
ncbi:MAG: zinc-ribbon domain-containing protein [Anaerolineae bacterium]